MNRVDDKLKFIELRAKGEPYSKIAKKLKVAKSTLVDWNRELSEEIAEHRTERLRELYDSYFMMKEARIQQLGDTLKAVNKALDTKDLAEMSTGQLLEYKLKLIQELKGEFIDLETETSMKLNAEAILAELMNLLRRFREGHITSGIASRETIILVNALKAYEDTNIEKKLDSIKSILEGRK